jgi:hypothetical protein
MSVTIRIVNLTTVKILTLIVTITICSAFRGIPQKPFSSSSLTRMSTDRDKWIMPLQPSGKPLEPRKYYEVTPTNVVLDEINRFNDMTNAVNLSNKPGVAIFPGVWDPLGVSTKLTEKTYRIYAEAEVKHARLAMMVFLGIFFGETIGNDINFWKDAVNGSAIQQYVQIGNIYPAFYPLVIMAASMLEVGSLEKIWYQPEISIDEPWSFPTPEGEGTTVMKDSYTVGDIGFDPLKIAPRAPEKMKDMKTKELNNGRLAMLAVVGIAVQENITGASIF